MVICLQQDADLHMAQLMPLPLTDSCFSKIQIGFPFLVPAHPGNPAQRAIKRVCVCIGNIESYLGNGDSVDNAGEENSSIFNLNKCTGCHLRPARFSTNIVSKAVCQVYLVSRFLLALVPEKDHLSVLMMPFRFSRLLQYQHQNKQIRYI